MPTKDVSLDEVLGKARETARKTQELLREAEALHNMAGATQRKAEELHGKMIENREVARDRNNRRKAGKN